MQQSSVIKNFIVLLLGFLAISLSLAANSASAGTNSDRIVVMISVDGLAGFYLDDPKAEMPTIRALAAQGARASSMKASTPTVTWPNHTTLVTGVHPARHGVMGNNYFDRIDGRKVILIADPEFDKDQIVKAPTIYDVAKAAGLKTAGVRWPASRNAKTLDWAVPDVGTDALVKKYSTASLLVECEQSGIHLVKEGNEKRSANDEDYTKAFNLILTKHRPQLALLHITEVDHTQHQKGPRSPEAYAAIKEADERVREVWNTLQKDYPGKATLLIVSDHGFSPIKKIILPNVVLREAGLSKGRKKYDENAVTVVAQGGTAFLYVKDEKDRADITKQVKKAFAGMEGVERVVGIDEFDKYGVANPKNDPHAPDILIFSKLGYVFGDTAAGTLPFEEKPERKGSHGHDPNIPDLHATFVAWGDGINPGVKLGEISNTSVAPTIAKLLDLKLPGTDGKPLTKALTK